MAVPKETKFLHNIVATKTPADMGKHLPVSHVFLHQPISVLGAINTERSLNNDKQPGIKMYWVPEWHALYVEHKGVRCLIALTNVVSAVIAD